MQLEKRQSELVVQGEEPLIHSDIVCSEAPTKLTELNKIKPNNNFFIYISSVKTPKIDCLYAIYEL